MPSAGADPMELLKKFMTNNEDEHLDEMSLSSDDDDRDYSTLPPFKRAAKEFISVILDYSALHNYLLGGSPTKRILESNHLLYLFSAPMNNTVKLHVVVISSIKLITYHLSVKVIVKRLSNFSLQNRKYTSLNSASNLTVCWFILIV